MATVSAIAANLFETIGFVRPRIEVMVRETAKYTGDRQPLRMHWVHDVDCNGRRVIRIQWTEDCCHKDETSDRRERE
jgi:hypothetical protein